MSHAPDLVQTDELGWLGWLRLGLSIPRPPKSAGIPGPLGHQYPVNGELAGG